MEASRPYSRGFRIGNVLGDPFALATLSIASVRFLFTLQLTDRLLTSNLQLAWFICFIATIFAQVNQKQDGNELNKFVWWALFYTLFFNIGVFVIVASDVVHTYHVALTGYASAGIVLTSSAVNSLIYSKSGAREAGAAGFLLLAIVDVLWTFYFGSTQASTPRAFIDSFALSKDSNMRQQGMSSYGGTGRPETSHSVQPPQMYNPTQLSAFDNNSTMNRNQTPTVQAPTFGSNGPQQTQKGPGAPDAEVVPPSEYPYRAKAIYSYDANPEDANEISFAKHEILEVSDISGRWWQAKKESGETGIAPSNYLVLV